LIDFIKRTRPVELGDKGLLRPGQLLWLRSVAWMIGFTFLIVLSFGPLGQFVSDLLPKDDLPLRFVARIFGAFVALAVYVLLVRFVEQRAASELRFKTAPRELAIGLLAGLLTFSVVMAILVVGGLHEVTLNGLRPAWRAGGAAIEAGVVEELIVRGVIMRLLWRAFGPTVAFAGSALLFGAGHLPNEGASLFAAACIAIEAGVMLGAFYALTGRLWVSIGFHAAWNFTQGYIFGVAVSGGNLGTSFATSSVVHGKPDWLTGGAFGPEASLPALVVCSTVGFVAMWIAWKTGRFGDQPTAPEEPAPRLAAVGA
jgi:membrane protease YdiL (CAAX protease family)